MLAVVYAFPMIEWKGILAGFDAAARLLAPDSGALVGLHIDANRLLTILLGVVMLEAAAFPICLRRLWQPNF